MRKTVLHIDDEVALAEALRVRLSAMGYQVHTAPGGLAGLAAAQKHRPDVILLDIAMPDIDGYEVCRRLRRDPVLGHTAVIFLSANVQAEARRQATAVGGNAFIPKPYEPGDVVAAIERM